MLLTRPLVLKKESRSVTPKVAFSIAEASRVLSIGRTSLYEAIKRGDLRVFKVGRRTLIAAEAIQALISSNEAANQAKGGGK